LAKTLDYLKEEKKEREINSTCPEKLLSNGEGLGEMGEICRLHVPFSPSCHFHMIPQRDIIMECIFVFP
jgi:hypothetical protein